eukprot:13216778-Ditylum_brightwellii.AAC.1
MDPNIGVATNGGTNSCPEGIGTTKVEWKDNRIIHTYYLQKALYFPNSPVNIISIKLLAEQLENDKGSFVTTRENI